MAFVGGTWHGDGQPEVGNHFSKIIASKNVKTRQILWCLYLGFENHDIAVDVGCFQRGEDFHEGSARPGGHDEIDNHQRQQQWRATT